ncbi:hypothetical protein [Streptomyces sp. NPDC005303]|uniref:hypothetical protein n=1 Tax=Streptomyces sp. NPDC005303 TaxID=3155713 RepID=UPI00339F614C
MLHGDRLVSRWRCCWSPPPYSRTRCCSPTAPRSRCCGVPLPLPLARALVRTTRARPWHAAVVAGALAGLSFAYGAYPVVIADTPP